MSHSDEDLAASTELPSVASRLMPEERGGANRLRVLVVDDRADYTMALTELLREWGCNATSARTARNAIETAQSFRPRVVILDLGLPDMHGYDVAKRMRAQAVARPPHFIVVTGWSQIADQLSSSALGIDHHLLKPLNPTELKKILETYQASEAQKGYW